VIVRAAKFVLWTLVVFVTLAFFLFMTQIGDCPEKVVDPSLGGGCTTQKHLWGWGLLIAGGAAWILGGYFIFRRREHV